MSTSQLIFDIGIVLFACGVVFAVDQLLLRLERLESAPKAAPEVSTPEMPEVVPTFTTGPSCAYCREPIDPEEAIKVEAQVPIIDTLLPVTLLIHQSHSLFPPVGAVSIAQADN